jgi:hypothetical protein
VRWFFAQSILSRIERKGLKFFYDGPILTKFWYFLWFNVFSLCAESTFCCKARQKLKILPKYIQFPVRYSPHTALLMSSGAVESVICFRVVSFHYSCWRFREYAKSTVFNRSRRMRQKFMADKKGSQLFALD